MVCVVIIININQCKEGIQLLVYAILLCIDVLVYGSKAKEGKVGVKDWDLLI